MATGLYGSPLPAPGWRALRLVVPWKYGFKGIALMKIELVANSRQHWKSLASNEYGFYANVNPDVPHPRYPRARSGASVNWGAAHANVQLLR
jgi:sulfoxide reductase catalytic subunit YedY